MALFPPPKSTPPRLLHSQLAYRDETARAGGGTDEVGGRLCARLQKEEYMCEPGFVLTVFRGAEMGRVVQSCVRSRYHTVHTLLLYWPPCVRTLQTQPAKRLCEGFGDVIQGPV